MYDVSDEAVKLVNDAACCPSRSPAPRRSSSAWSPRGGSIATTDPAAVGWAENVVVVIGTPVDEHLNPDPHAIPRALQAASGHLRDGQLLVLRSTVYPGVTALVERQLAGLGADIDVAFCPERIAEGQAMVELHALPQIVSSRTERAPATGPRQLFARLTERTRLRHARGGRAGQAVHQHLALHQVRRGQPVLHDGQRPRPGLRADPHAPSPQDYPRAADMPGAGLRGRAVPVQGHDAAGRRSATTTSGSATPPCWSTRGCRCTSSTGPSGGTTCQTMTVGILGMAFKGGSDDIRASLSYKLRRILRVQGREVLDTDPRVTVDDRLLPLDEVLQRCGPADRRRTARGVPRAASPDKPVIDVWNCSATACA